MAVLGWRETAKGSGASGSLGNPHVFVRSFLVRVDHPATSRVAITGAPGITYGTPYPDQTDHVAYQFDTALADDAGLWWTVTWQYSIPAPEKQTDENGIPEDSWQASGGTSVGPVYKDIDDESITNSAGDPLEGLERENDNISWVLTRSYDDMSWDGIRSQKSNTVNNATWLGKPAGTWKCNFRGAQKKQITKTDVTGGGTLQDDGFYTPATATEEKVSYWETSWEFRYRKDGWELKPWDVGFNELCDEDGNPSSEGTKRLAVTGVDGRPVKQPVALSDGVAMTAGEPPVVINNGDGAKVYEESDFTLFGEPS